MLASAGGARSLYDRLLDMLVRAGDAGPVAQSRPRLFWQDRGGAWPSRRSTRARRNSYGQSCFRGAAKCARLVSCIVNPPDIYLIKQMSGRAKLIWIIPSRRSAHHLEEPALLIQPGMFHGAEIVARYDSHHMPVITDRQMAETAIVQQAQRVHRRLFRSKRHGVAGHDMAEGCVLGIAAFRQAADGIAAGEDADEALFALHHQYGADAAAVHRRASRGDGGLAVQHERALVPNDLGGCTLLHGVVSALRPGSIRHGPASGADVGQGDGCQGKGSASRCGCPICVRMCPVAPGQRGPGTTPNRDIRSEAVPVVASDIMSHPPVTARPEQSIAEVAALLAERGISAVPVCASDKVLLGIISELDIIRPFRESARQRSDWWLSLLEAETLSQEFMDFVRRDNRSAADVMQKHVITAGRDTTLPQLAELMTAHSLKRIPIVEQGQVVGIVSRADIVSAIARSPAMLV